MLKPKPVSIDASQSPSIGYDYIQTYLKNSGESARCSVEKELSH